MKDVTKVLVDAVENGAFPGAVWWASRNGTMLNGSVGRATYCPDSPTVNQESIFDLASVSKVIGTTSMAMILFQEGKFALEEPVSKVVPAFGQNGKQALTFGHLLRHDAGLIAFRPYHKTLTESKQVKEAIYAEKLQYEPGTKSIYSDLSMITLCEAMERLAGQPMQKFLAERVFAPLDMTSTGYFLSGHPEGTFLKPDPMIRAKVVPTERIEDWRRALWNARLGEANLDKYTNRDAEYIQGEVHDPTATVLGGVAGHAGLFSTVPDISKYLLNLLQRRPKLFQREVVDLFTRKQTQISTRGLGWDTKSPEGSSAGTKFGRWSYGHTGYTGTCVWVDPASETAAILFTNRVHPTSENLKISKVRPAFHDAVWDALGKA